MRGKRQDSVKKLFTAFLVVMVAFSFHATILGNQEKKSYTTTSFSFSVGLKGGWSYWVYFATSTESFEKIGKIPGYSFTNRDLNVGKKV